MEDSSSFFSIPEFSSQEGLASLKLIHSSEHGFCDVFRIDRGGRFRALKCLKPEHRGDALYENILRKEFEIGYTLDHINICEYYSFTKVEGLGNCIEMEWVDGRSLEKVITEEKPSKELSGHILDSLCDALSYLHSKQIIHRDLKPSNIMVTHKGDTVKIIDFGLSDSDAHSILKSPAGTVEYTAPEVLRGETADVRSDIYSLGVIMSRLSGKYLRITKKCCESDPAGRFSSAAEVKKALHGDSRGGGIIASIFLIVILFLLAFFGGNKKEPAAPATAPEDSPAAVNVKPLTDTDVESAKPESAPAVRPDTPAKPSSPKSSGDAKAKTAPATSPSSEEQPVDPAVIDELFRQATDLFD